MSATATISLPRKQAQLVQSIGSAVTLDECNLLYRFASEVRSGCIVEIGSFHGRSTAALAFGSKAGGYAPVYAIEPHERFTGPLGGEFFPDDRAEFFKNMLRVGVADTVRLVNLSSEIVTKGWVLPVGLLWIDGDHEYTAVRRDYDMWRPFLLPGACILFHDSLELNLGPHRVIQELLTSGECEKVDLVGVITVLRLKHTTPTPTPGR